LKIENYNRWSSLITKAEYKYSILSAKDEMLMRYKSEAEVGPSIAKMSRENAGISILTAGGK